MNAPTQESIVIVSGLPRSGTSMMMQMLKAGGLEVLTDEIRVADEDNPRGYFEFEPVKRTSRDRSWLDDAAGKGVKMVYLLLHDLPTDRPCRIIMMRRNLADVLASQTAMLDRMSKPKAALAPDRLAQIFETQVNRALAFLQNHGCFEVLEVWYDAVLASPLQQADAINTFLGGRLSTDDMAAAVEPTLRRQKA